MNSDKVLVFDVSGEYAHFRKFNTTTSPLTYSLPSRPVLAGMLGAILGVERETAPNVFPAGVTPVNELFHPQQAQIAVRLMRPVRKSRHGYNLLDTSKQGSSFFNIKNRTQIEVEFLKDVRFRIYLQHADETIFNNLYRRITTRNHHFTPYLGVAHCTATIDFVGLFKCQKLSNLTDVVAIHSAINISNLQSKDALKLSVGSFTVDTLPDIMLRNREVTRYVEIMIEKNAATIYARPHEFVQVNNQRDNQKENILFL